MGFPRKIAKYAQNMRKYAQICAILKKSEICAKYAQICANMRSTYFPPPCIDRVGGGEGVKITEIPCYSSKRPNSALFFRLTNTGGYLGCVSLISPTNNYYGPVPKKAIFRAHCECVWPLYIGISALIVLQM